MTLCPFSEWKHALGVPGEGAHQYRFLNTAIVDYVLSILLAIVITAVSNIPLVLTTILVLVSGIVLHMLFGVNTNTINYLGLTC